MRRHSGYLARPREGREQRGKEKRRLPQKYGTQGYARRGRRSRGQSRARERRPDLLPPRRTKSRSASGAWAEGNANEVMLARSARCFRLDVQTSTFPNRGAPGSTEQGRSRDIILLQEPFFSRDQARLIPPHAQGTQGTSVFIEERRGPRVGAWPPCASKNGPAALPGCIPPGRGSVHGGQRAVGPRLQPQLRHFGGLKHNAPPEADRPGHRLPMLLAMSGAPTSVRQPWARLRPGHFPTRRSPGGSRRGAGPGATGR